MNEAYQAAIQEAFAIAPANKIIYHTLEVRQEGVQEAVYMVQAREGISATDENGNVRAFQPVGFQFSLPPSSEEGFRSLNIAIDNIDHQVTDFIENAKSKEEPVKVYYRPYLSDDLTTPQMQPPLVLFLKDIRIGTVQVTGRATFMDIVNKKFPSQLYNRVRFPALG